MRSKEEKSRQIEGLESMKSWLPEFNVFGDNNYDEINIQIDVIEGRTDSDGVEIEYDDVELAYSYALSAEDWLSGNSDEDLFETR